MCGPNSRCTETCQLWMMPGDTVDALVESRDQQIAVAPETGSDRLRKVINKNLTGDEIVDICGSVFDRGMLTVKLYMMVGLPTETHEDVAAISFTSTCRAVTALSAVSWVTPPRRSR